MPNLLNGVQCDNFEWRGKDSVEFSLACTYDEAASVRAPLVVTDGGETVASFGGMEPVGVWPSGESFRLRASRELSEASAGAIRALEDNVGALSAKVTATDAKADEAKATAEKAKGAVADATSAAQTATEAAATAQTTADEAKSTAGTAAASVNEYMDALLGLGATSETGATDAE